jgi:hypothetical protein
VRSSWFSEADHRALLAVFRTVEGKMTFDVPNSVTDGKVK